MLILPTDTCYGLAGSLTPEDYEMIYQLKGRDFSKPLALLVRDFDMLRQYSETTDDQVELLQDYPYPWSVLLTPRWDILPDWMDRSQYEKISFRIGSKCIDANIRDKISYPLFLTSANASGQVESHTLQESTAIFPGILGYDGGVCDRPPSDIFFFTDEGVKYLRKNY